MTLSNERIDSLISEFLGDDTAVKVQTTTTDSSDTTTLLHVSKQFQQYQKATDLVFDCITELRLKIDVKLIDSELQVLSQIYQNLCYKTKQSLHKSSVDARATTQVEKNEQIDNVTLEEKQKEQKQITGVEDEDQQIFEYLLQLTLQQTQLEAEIKQLDKPSTATATADSYNVQEEEDVNQQRIKLTQQLSDVNWRIKAAGMRHQKLHQRYKNNLNINNIQCSIHNK